MWVNPAFCCGKKTLLGLYFMQNHIKRLFEWENTHSRDEAGAGGRVFLPDDRTRQSSRTHVLNKLAGHFHGSG